MVTKRKRTSEPNNLSGTPVPPNEVPRVESAPVEQSGQRTAPAPAPATPAPPAAAAAPAPKPRKRTDAPAKATRPLPSKKAVQAVAPEPAPAAKSIPAPLVKAVFATSSESGAEEASSSKRPSRFKRAKPAEDAQKAPASKRRAAQKHKHRWPFFVVGAILVVALAVVAALSWDRWLRYDDAVELQGEWQTHGSTAVVVIDGEQIKLTDEVAYSYTLDAGAKTLSYTFGNWTGEGRYRFSLDRSQLTIFDGSGATWLSTLTDDLGWMLDQAIRFLQGQAPEDSPISETTTVLDRLSHDASASPREGTADTTEEPQAPATDADAGSPDATDAADTTDTTDAADQPESTPDPDVANPTDPTNAQDDPNSDTSAVPGGLFDVNDVAA